MTQSASFYVILDANVWVTERLLQSSMGSALLLALTEANALIGVPEIVEAEVNNVLPDMAVEADAKIRREHALLQQLSGQNLTYEAPTASAIKKGIKERWKQLEGVLTRIPFTFEQAKAALDRVMRKLPPSGKNNEQFRDCCIWEAALSLAGEHTVHLITNDLAFYQGRNASNGLASQLARELSDSKREVHIYSDLQGFLTTMKKSVRLADQAHIKAAIAKAVTSSAREIASRGEFGDMEQFELGEARRLHISGYATPQPSLIAVSFEISFDLKLVEARADEEKYRDARLTVKGVCSYDPNSKDVSDIQIREWWKAGTGWGMGWLATKPPGA